MLDQFVILSKGGVVLFEYKVRRLMLTHRDASGATQCGTDPDPFPAWARLLMLLSFLSQDTAQPLQGTVDSLIQTVLIEVRPRYSSGFWFPPVDVPHPLCRPTPF